MTLPATKAEAKAIRSPYYFTGKPCKNGHICKRKTSNSGCYECKKVTDAARRQTPEYKSMMRDLQAERRKNPDVIKAEREAQSRSRRTDEYRERVRPFNREFKKNNRALYNALRAKRDAAKKSRTPAWLTESDNVDIKALYVQARQLTKETGVEHHVDHIVPLQGSLVSGLHVPWNLQVLTAKENMQKNNRFEVNA